MPESRISPDGPSPIGSDQASRISLDGTWDFLHIADDRLTGPADIRSIAVPGPWQAQFRRPRMRGGIGIYRRPFEIQVGWNAGAVFLRFGAGFPNAPIWVNGRL